MRNVAIRFCYLFLATLLGSALFADTLPRPIGVAFDKGALLTVAGYTGASPLSGFPVLVRIKVNSPAGFFYTDLHSQTDGADIAFVPVHSGVSCGEFKYGVDGAPLADGASLSAARQILLDLNGYGGRALFINLR